MAVNKIEQQEIGDQRRAKHRRLHRSGGKECSYRQAPHAGRIGKSRYKPCQRITRPFHLGPQLPPSMYNVVRQNGRDVHLVIKPDVDCVVNSGLGSVRGSRMAENRRSDVTGTQQQHLTAPMVWRYGTYQPTSGDDALDLVASVTARVIDKDKEDDLLVSMFDHGGSAGGHENLRHGEAVCRQHEGKALPHPQPPGL